MTYFQAENETAAHDSENEKSPICEYKLLTGGEQMKFQGITIYKNKKCNTWYCRYRSGGKQYYLSARTQQACYEKLKAALKTRQKVERQTNSDLKNITLRAWFEKWLVLYKSDRKQNTKKGYNKSFKYLESIESKRMLDITSLEVLELLNGIPYSRTRQMVHELLKCLFEKARIHKLVSDNIMEDIERPKHKKEHGIPISSEDEESFIRILKQKQEDIFLVTLFQGFRRGEVLAITGEDLDFENRTININKAINEFDEVDRTKTEYSDRVVPMFKNSYEILLKYKNIKDRIFNFSYYSIEKRFKNIIKNNFSGKKYTIKSLRHTFITKCQEQGIPLHIIQKWVGHIEGSEITDKVYTHPRDAAENECINIINNI